MPWQAELLIEQYAETDGTLIEPPLPIEHTLIPPEYRAGSAGGSILLLDRDSAFVNLSGSLVLPSGEYRLTISVTMDPGTPPASRLDIAHIYSNLTTPASFYYGGGDLYISNASPDSGASFITGFTFTETPNATTVIGSEPGLDGTRMIMVMVPSVTKDNDPVNLTALTPSVTTATGSVVTSPLPAAQPAPPIIDPVPPAPGPATVTYAAGQIDFTNHTIWTAQAKNGVMQKYTVVVSMIPEGAQDKSIVYFFFEGYADYPGIIDQSGAAITVILPYYKPGTDQQTTTTGLTPVISIIGQKVTKEDNSPVGADNFGSAKKFRVYANGDLTDTPEEYEVTVTIAVNSEADITRFAIDGYPDRPGL